MRFQNQMTFFLLTNTQGEWQPESSFIKSGGISIFGWTVPLTAFMTEKITDTDSSSFNTASQSHILTQAVPIFGFRFRFCQKASKFGGLLTSVQEVFDYTSFQ